MHLKQRQVETASNWIWTFLQDLRVNSPTTGNKARSPVHPRITRNNFFLVTTKFVSAGTEFITDYQRGYYEKIKRVSTPNVENGA